MKTKRISATAIVFGILVIALFISCKKEEEFQRFKVAGFYPSNNLEGVIPILNGSAVFNYDIDLDVSTFEDGILLYDQNHNKVLIEFANTVNSVQFVLPRGTILEYGMRYTVEITSALRSTDGRRAEEYSWSFTTMDPTFNLISTTPLDGAKNVPVNTKIKFVFNKRLDVSSIDEYCVVLLKSKINLTPFQYSYDGDKTLTIIPLNNLSQLVEYFTGPVLIKSVDGEDLDNHIGGVYFTTGN